MEALTSIHAELAASRKAQARAIEQLERLQRDVALKSDDTPMPSRPSDPEPTTSHPEDPKPKRSRSPLAKQDVTVATVAELPGLARKLSTAAEDMCGAIDPKVARYFLCDVEDEDVPPSTQAAMPPAPSVSARDELFAECCAFLLRSGGPPRIDPDRGKFDVLERWLADHPAGRAFVTEQGYHIDAMIDRAVEGAHGKELLAWARCVDCACKEVGPREAHTDMGADQLQPLFEYVIVHARPRAAFTALSRMEDLLRSELDNGWLTATPVADHALMFWRTAVPSIVHAAIRRWRRCVCERAMFAVLAAAPAALLARCATSRSDGSDAGDQNIEVVTADEGGATWLQLDQSAEPLAGLLAAAREEERSCWVSSLPDGYLLAVSNSMQSLVASAAEVAWLSLEPTGGAEASFYPREAALQLEAAYQQQLARLHDAPAMLLAARVELGSRCFNATVHLPPEGDGQSFMFQTTPSGGHRSVRRWAFPLADAPTADGPQVIDLPIVRTSAGEWAFATAVSEPLTRSVQVGATMEHVVFSMPWMLRRSEPASAPATAAPPSARAES